MVKGCEITLEEYIAGKGVAVPGLENWPNAVRNGQGPITIFGILQPIISALLADETKIANVDLAPSNSTSNRETQNNSSCVFFGRWIGLVENSGLRYVAENSNNKRWFS